MKQNIHKTTPGETKFISLETFLSKAPQAILNWTIGKLAEGNLSLFCKITDTEGLLYVVTSDCYHLLDRNKSNVGIDYKDFMNSVTVYNDLILPESEVGHIDSTVHIQFKKQNRRTLIDSSTHKLFLSMSSLDVILIEENKRHVSSLGADVEYEIGSHCHRFLVSLCKKSNGKPNNFFSPADLEIGYPEQGVAKIFRAKSDRAVKDLCLVTEKSQWAFRCQAFLVN